MSEFIEIDEEGEIDVEAIMHQIRAHVVARKVATDDRLSELPSRFSGRLSPGLYEAFYQMVKTYDQIEVPALITETPIPILGQLWMKVRRRFHDLILFYTTQAAARQIVFNRHLVALADEIVKELEVLPTADQVAELHREVARLRGKSSDLTQGEDKDR